jgi:trimeric autotransporter adhesin
MRPRVTAISFLAIVALHAPAFVTRAIGDDLAAGANDGWLSGFGNPVSIPGSTGEPTCALVYQDALIIGGSLEEVCGEPMGFVARWDGSSWISYAEGLDAFPQCLIEYQGELIAGGTFRSAGGEAADFVAAWDGVRWRGLGGGLTGGTGNGVTALCVYEGDLIAAGDFDAAGGHPASCIARWDGTTWHPLGEGLGGRLDTRVLCLAEFDGALIAGGRFAWAGGQEIPFIAQWNGQAWSPLGSGVNEIVRALRVFDGSLVVGGDFGEAGGTAAVHVARWDGASWTSMGTGLGALAGGQTVTCLTEFYGELIAGGSFDDAGELDLVNIARWDAEQGIWRPVGAGLDGRVVSLAALDRSLYACGAFTRAGAAEAQNIARWDGQWSALCAPQSGNGFDGPVHALAMFRGDLVAGGEYSRAGGTDAPFLARLKDSVWDSIGTGGPNGPVLRLYREVGGFVAMGPFPIGGTLRFAAAAIFYVSPDEWGYGFFYDPYGPPPNPPLGYRHQEVTAICPYGDRAYIGWRCDDSAEMLIRAGFHHDASPWYTVLGDRKRVETLVVYQDRLIAGGSFLSVDGVSAKRVASWNGSEWSALAQGIEPTQGSATVYCLTVIGDTLYAAGRFRFAGDQLANNIAKWDGQRWLPLGAIPGCDGPVLALAEVHGTLIAGGDFTHAGGIEARSIAQWDGHGWSPLGSGINGVVESLAFDGTTLYAGGSFTSAGGIASHYIAAWTPGIVSETCVFPRLTAGQEQTRTIALQNPRDEAVTLTLIGSPEIPPFSLSDSFKDSLQAGVPLPPHGSIHTQVLFLPTEAGSYGDRLRFLLSPIGREIYVDLSGSARELTMEWTSRDLYEPYYRVTAGDSVYVEVTLAESVAVERMDLSFREGGARTYERTAMQLAPRNGPSDRYASYIPARMTGVRGLEFHVEGGNGAVTAQIGDSSTPIRMRVDLPSVTFPSPQPATEYRLISVPLQMPDAWIKVILGDDLGPTDATSWRMFSYDPDSAGYRDLSTGEEFVHQGRGYWLITRDSLTLDTEPIVGISTPVDSAYTMTLAPGWNLIANPFAFPVAWDSVEVGAARAARKTDPRDPLAMARDLVERPVAWNGQEYVPEVTVLRPFEGYWLYNQTEEPVNFRIPPVEEVDSVPPASRVAEGTRMVAGPDGTAAAEGEWRVRVGASLPHCRDTYNYAGMRHGALDGLDRFDRAEPPLAPGDGVALYFPRLCVDGELRHLRTEMRGPTAALPSHPGARRDSVGLAWPFDVAKTFFTGDRDDRVTLTFEWSGDLPADLSALVIDRDLGNLIDPLSAEGYAFDLGVRGFVRDPSACRFVLLVGSREFLEEEAVDQIVRPAVTRLHTPGPNPSPGPVTVRFDLAGSAMVRVGVHDLSGARVRVLWDGERPAGRHQLTWNGEDDRGRPLASGIYFVRLEAVGTVQTRKVVLIR